jgi:DNA (cytosine-5)-methyltransferase 1
MRPRLLDLFCGAGGASMGYHRAGFEVVGVDIVDQPHYPFTFVQADAMTYDLDGYDAIHASPPCHDHSTATGRDRRAHGVKGTGWMLAAMLEQLQSQAGPWVVENVDTAQYPGHYYRVRLCGSSFGLDLRRHRWFASNVALLVPSCAHGWQTPRFVSLDGKRRAAQGGYLARVVGVHGHVNYTGEAALRERAMGIDWMTQSELAQAIPPAYTEYLGRQVLAYLELRT